MTMTSSELVGLEKQLAQGPRLTNSALLGAGVGTLIGWFAGRRIGMSAVQGAAGGVVVGLLVYGYGQWASARASGNAAEPLTRGEFAGLSPYPYYRPSLSYPWSSH